DAGSLSGGGLDGHLAAERLDATVDAGEAEAAAGSSAVDGIAGVKARAVVDDVENDVSRVEGQRELGAVGAGVPNDVRDERLGAAQQPLLHLVGQRAGRAVGLEAQFFPKRGGVG